jgi:DNA-binding GntR family transcriptional regulator
MNGRVAVLAGLRIMESPEPEYPADRVTRLPRARLEAGDWVAPGERLPSVAALAVEYRTGHGTIRKALGRLQDEGWIVTLPRYGTFRSRQGPAKD